jgi:ring-1,2-phenylacetyl-CoA epoxidase subunit PaaB
MSDGLSEGTFEVFARRTWQARFEHCGTIHAPDAEAAMLLARETHMRHEEGVQFAVCPSEAFQILDDPSLLERKVDMTYRLQAGYSGFREKRERARAAAQARGRGHLAEQPSPGRRGDE